MIGGYVRLSRDEDKKNYVSIEHQKLIIEQFALKQGFVIDRWYEDDNISGYTFNRPDFTRMVADLDRGIDIIISKDLSRIGRHNAKVLLFLDTIKEQGKRLLLVDDDYDTFGDEDDVIGIKTWYNERYIKDTSKKIKRVFRARQQEGDLLYEVPMGYRRNPEDRTIIEIVPDEAEYIKIIFNLYLQGNGYRKISYYLNDHKVPTPSMLALEEAQAQGKVYRRQVTTKWSDSMVGDLLKNDFYMGTIRFHKRERLTIHGTDKKVPKEEQIVFEDNHDPIIDRQTFDLVQSIMRRRVKSNYRGQGSKENLFGGYLYCKDCGSRLTPILRTKRQTKKYYICNTYNSKGKRYCAHTHSVTEEQLSAVMIQYLQNCRESLKTTIETYNINQLIEEQKSQNVELYALKKRLDKSKKELKNILSQKLQEISLNPDSRDIINEVYKDMQDDILERIHELERQIRNHERPNLSQKDIMDGLISALSMIDNIVTCNSIRRSDIERLIDKIIVDKDGMFDIHLKRELASFISYDMREEINQKENEIQVSAMQAVLEESRPYTSAKYMSEHLTAMGHKKSKRSVLPYIHQMINDKILEPTDNPLQPYQIIKEKKDIEERIKFYIKQGQPPFRPPNTSVPIRLLH